jgi:hypothetical protein
MPKVILTTGKPIDGEYDLDLSTFTWRERAYITEISGTKPPEFIRKWFDHDPLTIIATVGVMMQRAGRVPDLDSLLDADEGAITLDYSDLVEEEEEEEAGPPAEASPPSDDTSGESSDVEETSG